MRMLREVLAGAGLLLLVGTLLEQWPSLPARVPEHFAWSGIPDRFGPRSTLLILPTLAIVLYLGLTFLARFPQTFNYPVKITELNRSAVERLGVGLVGWLKTVLMWLFAWLTIAVTQVSTGRASALSPAFTLIALGAVAVTIIVFWRRMRAA